MDSAQSRNERSNKQHSPSAPLFIPSIRFTWLSTPRLKVILRYERWDQDKEFFSHRKRRRYLHFLPLFLLGTFVCLELQVLPKSRGKTRRVVILLDKVNRKIYHYTFKCTCQFRTVNELVFFSSSSRILHL